ncbi:hydroxymethylglutaryl-CoA lyase [Pedomonas mirosovicensis]|uniref:hydroxymethylglutaryl-CoA lyase n=1 Tax=Pedomonas mirosovicensis TaxID=2908641 RepID=UPI00286EFF46|nr:hydroxymethylglutaryl-CoA lyase [Pedomonas mirosovicensis]
MSEMNNGTVSIVEVGARDGLQNEPEVFSTETKVELLTRMMDAGARRLEVASFVHPKLVPQMADAEAVVASLPDRKDVSYIGLVLNKRGLLRALATREGDRRGVDEAGCVAVATDSFGQRNQGQSIEDSIRETSEMLRLAKAEGLVPQVTVSVAFGCPFEGEVPQARVLEIIQRLAENEPAEIALADTIGAAVPQQVSDLFGPAREKLPEGIRLRAHFHNTRNTGIANAWAAYQAGAEVLDSSVGGLGGCPFAPRATGNIATEDLLYLLERSDVSTGLSLEDTIATAQWFEGVRGKPSASMLAKAGPFPARG